MRLCLIERLYKQVLSSLVWEYVIQERKKGTDDSVEAANVAQKCQEVVNRAVDLLGIKWKVVDLQQDYILVVVVLLRWRSFNLKEGLLYICETVDRHDQIVLSLDNCTLQLIALDFWQDWNLLPLDR